MSNRSWRFAALLLVLALAGAWASPAAAQYCGNPTVVPLYSGSIEVGRVTITNNESQVFVQYEVEEPWTLRRTNSIVSRTLSGIPRNSDGPITSYFPARSSFTPVVDFTVQTLSRTSSLVDGSTVYIVANAKVQRQTRCGTDYRAAWAGTRQFSSYNSCGGGSDATYLTYVIQSCIPGGE